MGIFRSGLAKTRNAFFGRLSQMIGVTEIDEDTWDDIEALLIQADLGTTTTEHVVEDLKRRVRDEGVVSEDGARKALKHTLSTLIAPPPDLNVRGRQLSVILVVGVNGSGKTTSIAKLSQWLKSQGRRVMLAAGDTFRAAAIEQLELWGERIGVPVIANKQNADAASVVFTAINAARARNCDVLIVDTAGRLHTNHNLMEELAKIRGVVARSVHEGPHEVLLVLDGTTGQNALQQAQRFREVVDVTGVVVTKLDGTAKGGMVFAVFQELELPVHFIGLGERVEDLARFDPNAFIDSLFSER